MPFRDVRYPGVNDASRARARKVHRSKLDCPRGLPVSQSRDGKETSRLAGTIASDHGDHLSGGYLKSDAVYHLHSAIAGSQVCHNEAFAHGTNLVLLCAAE